MWHWLSEMLFNRSAPPDDERTNKAAEIQEKAAEIRELGSEVRKTSRRINSIRSEALQAERRLKQQ
jgi:hypothetical protein